MLCRDNITKMDLGCPYFPVPTIHYRPKRSFGQGNIFRSVCHSVHRGWGGGWPGPEGGGVPPNFWGVPPNFQGGLQFFRGGVPPNF